MPLQVVSWNYGWKALGMRLFGSFQWKMFGDKSRVVCFPFAQTMNQPVYTHVLSKRQFQSCPKSLGYPYLADVEWILGALKLKRPRSGLLPLEVGTLRDLMTRTATRTLKKIHRFNIKKRNNFARASRFFVHFFARFCTTTTWKYLISCFMENVTNRRRNYISLSELGYSHLKFSFKRVRLHLTK